MPKLMNLRLKTRNSFQRPVIYEIHITSDILKCFLHTTTFNDNTTILAVSNGVEKAT